MPTLEGTTLETFLASYIQTAFWSTTDGDDEPLEDSYSRDDIHENTVKKMAVECSAFWSRVDEYPELVDYLNRHHEIETIAHDFWLTRCGHGAGFWDGDYGGYGDQLTAIATSFGNIDLYVGDDGLIYQMGAE